MRDEWEKVTLGDLMTFKNGLNFTQDSNGKEYKGYHRKQRKI